MWLSQDSVCLFALVQPHDCLAESGLGLGCTENHNSPGLGAVRDDFLKEVGLKKEEEEMTGQ